MKRRNVCCIGFEQYYHCQSLFKIIVYDILNNKFTVVILCKRVVHEVYNKNVFIKLQKQIVYKGTNKFMDIYKNVKTPVSVYEGY